MLSVLRWLRPDSGAARTRLLMVGAVFGAVATLFASMTFASQGGPFGTGPPGPDPMEQAREAAFEADKGMCLMWERADAVDMHEVDCTKTHVFEVTKVADVSDNYLAGAEMPGEEKWAKLVEKKCAKGTREYLGGKLDPNGRFVIAGLRPAAEKWVKGNRKVRCGLQRPGPGGTLQTWVGPVSEQNQSDVWPTGTCLALVDGAVGDPVPCEEPHAYEMVSIVDLSQEFKKRPSRSEQADYLDKTCARDARSYAKGRNFKKLKVIVSWDVRSGKSWDAGSHLVNCKVGALKKGGKALAPLEGSIKPADPPKPKKSKKSSETKAPESTTKKPN